MNKITLIVRLFLGALFFVFGLNGFFHFIPMPPMNPQATIFMNGMMATRYFMPFLAGIQVLCGFLLLVGAFVPLALVILAPIVVNILLFHLFVESNGLLMAGILFLAEAYLAFFAEAYKSIIGQIFRCPMKEACCEAKKK